MRRALTFVAILWLGLGSILVPAAEAASVQCSIPSGSYRVHWFSGCASLKWVKSGSSSYYGGYVHDRSSSHGSVVVEYESSPGVWQWLATDTYNGSSMTQIARTVSGSTCRVARVRDNAGTRRLVPCN